MNRLLLTLCGAALFAADHKQIPLWSRGAPGSEGQTAQELAEPPSADRVALRFSRIHNPSITVYLPKPGASTGTAMVVAPGGGHRYLYMHEGYDIGEWLASKGVAAFVLKYRLGREEGSPYKVDVHPQLDAKRAIRMIRSRAKEWNVDPDRIGIMGFSAGGEVALRTSLTYDAGDPNAADPIDRFSSKPAFQVLVYPGIRDVTLEGIKKDTPPAFLICTSDDKSPAETVPPLFTALMKAGVPVEMHIYAKGGHGYGIRKRPLPVSNWPTVFEAWLENSGFLKRASS
ncbi:MAG TPA: alpha/beta hydrolase [Bryobacteraceae bacterium]|nr:alpha/beta hydrolase [Bryobacteraceae bacterium]